MVEKAAWEAEAAKLAFIGAAEVLKDALLEASKVTGFDARVALRRARDMHRVLGKFFDEVEKQDT